VSDDILVKALKKVEKALINNRK